MKKKKLQLNKKLSLNKAAIASLNAAQQAEIAGGIAPVTFPPRCLETYAATCETIPAGQMFCVVC